MSTNKSLTKKQEQLLAMVEQGWIPLQVVVDENHPTSIECYWVNSASTIGHRYRVEPSELLGFTCTHQYGEFNSHHPCAHILAVQEYEFSDFYCVTFAQEVHLRCRNFELQATRGRAKWEWLISDSRGMSIGCMGVTVEDQKAQWWTTYEGNHNSLWQTCDEAINHLLAVVSF